MRFFRLMTITVLLLACVVLGTSCAGAKGEQGEAGADGVGIQSITNNGDGTFTVHLNNGMEYTTDNMTGPQGDEGDKGDTGNKGDKGDKGDQGAPGAGVAWQGVWSNAAAYSLNDAVGYQGSSYVSRQNDNTNHLPTDTVWWDLWVEKGDTGDKGNPGPNIIQAMGAIWTDGEVFHGFGIDSVTWDSVNSRWEIEFTNLNFSIYSCVAVVTPMYQSVTCRYSSVGNNLIVYTFDASGNEVQGAFSFIALKVYVY